MPNERVVKRLALIVMALFPASWGLLGDLNNVADFAGTANNAVKPMLAIVCSTWRMRERPR